MIAQPTVVKSRYIKLLQGLLAKRSVGMTPTNPIVSGLCEYLSYAPELRAEQRNAIQLSLLLIHYRTKKDGGVFADSVDISARTMSGILKDYHDRYTPQKCTAKLLEVAWAQVIADLRAIPADELTAILRAYYYNYLVSDSAVPSLAKVFESKPDAVALKRLSLPASGQTAFTKRIMEIVGE